MLATSSFWCQSSCSGRSGGEDQRILYFCLGALWLFSDLLIEILDSRHSALHDASMSIRNICRCIGPWPFSKDASRTYKDVVSKFATFVLIVVREFDLVIAMRYLALLTAIFALSIPAVCRDALSYAPEPPNLYVPEKNASVVTLYQLVSSRPELSSLASVLNEPAGTSVFVGNIVGCSKPSRASWMKLTIVGSTNSAFDVRVRKGFRHHANMEIHILRSLEHSF